MLHADKHERRKTKKFYHFFLKKRSRRRENLTWQIWANKYCGVKIHYVNTLVSHVWCKSAKNLNFTTCFIKCSTYIICAILTDLCHGCSVQQVYLTSPLVQDIPAGLDHQQLPSHPKDCNRPLTSWTSLFRNWTLRGLHVYLKIYLPFDFPSGISGIFGGMVRISEI